ncbi:MAG TPA: ABC transporter permease [Candidatus Borkfalkia excrementigallinarum]|uniref:ABC transporter permease n=1 Tax=Candidatus Borkfalkia excrementigallinarum TaxID=2838506 RepID=A0A9D2CS05_9FIRM|nr:ABC transporter permease [Candidatus Borkfalkia excrementigallinarum]
MNAYALWMLTRRNLKIFLKDKANVFFSLLAPLIVLALYALFLGRVQADGLLAALQEMGVAGGESEVRAFCDSWMLAGSVSCACITVPLCACGVMVTDRSRGISADLRVAPLQSWVSSAAYFLAVVAAGLAIGAVVLAVCFIWLAAAGAWALTVADVFGCIGALVLSVLCSSALLVFVVGFIRSQGAFTGLNIIFGTVVGFLIGAYMPITYFPKGVQYFTLFIPGSYTAGLFRNFMMGGALERIADTLSPAFADSLRSEFSLTFDFFGAQVGVPAMACVLAVCTAVFAACLAAAAYLRRRGQK